MKFSATKSIPLLVAVLLYGWSLGLQAHHSFAVHFVADELVTKHGVLTEFKFSNPHGMLTFMVTGEDGSVEEWRAETNSPNVLRRRGWSKDALHIGDEITVVGFPARDGSAYMRVSKITFADGHELVGQAASNQD